MFQKISLLFKGSEEKGEVLAPRSGLPAPQLEFVNDEIYVSREGMAAQPLLQNERFSIQISDEARCHIARTISRIVPNMVDHQKTALLEYTVRVLKVLCKDQMVRVREILSEELKEMAQAPHEVVRVLAQDEAVTVAVPMLECSPVLTDQDLVEIIKSSGVPEILEAIATRPRLSGMVSHALAEIRLPRPLVKLLSNPQAEIRDASYDMVTDVAAREESLHIPLVTRPDLPIRLVNKIAGFVSETVVQALVAHGRLHPQVQDALVKATKERLQDPAKDREKTAKASAAALQGQGMLDDATIEDALMGGNYTFVQQALAVLSGFSAETVGRIVRSENAKVITGLCWKAGISMRNCLEIQKRMGKIHHTKLVNAKGGQDYPLAPAEMEAFLDVFR